MRGEQPPSVSLRQPFSSPEAGSWKTDRVQKPEAPARKNRGKVPAVEGDSTVHTQNGEELTADREAVARALAQLRAAVRQRHAELAAVGELGDGDLALELAELKRREFVQEPVPVSPRPYGWLLVGLRKLAFHLGFKWHARAVWAQQNGFNQVAARLLREVLAREQELRRRLQRLERQVQELEASQQKKLPESQGSALGNRSA